MLTTKFSRAFLNSLLVSAPYMRNLKDKETERGGEGGEGGIDVMIQ